MTNDELNRKISEVRLGKAETAWTPASIHPDWTGSEEANAVLLEEMKGRVKWRDEESAWVANCNNGELVTIGIHVDRKVAIAKAWLKWKALI